MRKLICLIMALALAAPMALAETETVQAPELLEDIDPVREEILSAMEMYSWFIMSPLDVNVEAEPLSNGYLPVLDEELGQTQVMRDLLLSRFAEEICDSLWDWGAYVDKDGWLYGALPEESLLARPMDEQISDATYELTEETDTLRTITASVYYLYADEPTLYTFVCEKVGDNWIYTEFPFFW